MHDKALLDYELPPFVCLRVRAVAALQQPARLGPLLAHCGGPGSGRDCVETAMSDHMFDIDGQRQVLSAFDLVSVDQRGVNISADGLETEERWGEVKECPFKQEGEPIKAFPMALRQQFLSIDLEIDALAAVLPSFKACERS